jgi:hypothetical protein
MVVAPMAMASEEHLDVWIQNGGDGIVIGGISEDGTETFPDTLVFGAEFGEDPQEPFFADEPGFQAMDGDFAPFAPFQINIVDSLGAWNGDGFGLTDNTMTVSFGPATVTSGGGFIEGFQWQADTLGGFHDHFDLSINGDGGDPANGIYLLPLAISLGEELGGSPGLPGLSDTFYFVMNLGEDERQHDAAMDWVQANLVPGPGGAALLAGLLLLGRSRRQRA